MGYWGRKGAQWANRHPIRSAIRGIIVGLIPTVLLIMTCVEEKADGNTITSGYVIGLLLSVGYVGYCVYCLVDAINSR